MGRRRVLIVIYAVYVRLHFTDAPEPSDPEQLNRLHATRLPRMAGPHTLDIDILPGERDSWEIDGAQPRMRIIVSQVVVALALIIVGAQVFVGAVEHLSTAVGLDPTILALIIAPIATELPEKFNSVLWVRNPEGHAGDGQHHRRDGLPELPADRARPALHRRGPSRRKPPSASRRRASRSSPTILIFGLMLRSRPPLGVDAADRWARCTSSTSTWPSSRPSEWSATAGH